MNHDERVREDALNAAERLLNEQGRISFADTAQAAKVSVVELREQFPTAATLMTGLLARSLERFDQAVDRHLDHQHPSPGQLTRAFVAAALAVDDELGTPWRRASVVAAAVTRWEVLSMLDRWAARWQDEIANDGVDPHRAHLVLLAVSGLAAQDLLSSGQHLSEQDRRRAQETLDALLCRPAARLD